jgi:hypothetical protein
MATPEELLATHRPFLKYDSQESYFADSAAEMTDNPGNRLVRTDGTVLATAGDDLSLAFLGVKYPDKSRAARTDVISDPGRNYRDQARALHQNPAYRNRMYGHTVTDGTGRLWLQYWFFYFYNDYNLIGNIIRAGLHEGDWEMIQIRLDGETPDLAVYAQHKSSETRDWRQVDLLPGTLRPIVYVARGSHASYFEPGTHWTGVWFDVADGKRKSPEIALEIVDERKRAWTWIRWPGHWGDTKAAGSPLDSDSPVGPGSHEQWDDPLVLVDKAEARRAVPPPARPAPPPPPRVSAAWRDGHIEIAYEVAPTADGTLPTGISVTVNSPDEAAPPTTQQFPVDAAAGTVEIGAAVDPACSYDIYASAATAAGLASESVRLDLPGATAAATPGPGR